MIGLSLVIGAVALLLLLPTLADTWSVVALLSSRGSRNLGRAQEGGPLPRLLFLVPAHDEALLIDDCVRSLRFLRYDESSFEVVVIADNCTDNTADLARAAGVRCLERREPALPGKPRAIAWALERLSIGSFDAVVIVDADTVVDRGFAAGLATAAPLRDKGVQGYNGVSNPDENAITRMAAVFADAKCRVAYRLKARAGVNVPLRLGGCIGTSVLAAYGWQAFSIGEDWELYAQLTAWGVRIEGVDNARVYAQEASSIKQSLPQRQRWAAGRVVTLQRTLGSVIRSRRIGAHQKLDVIAELSAPGPVVHLAVALLLGVACVGLHVPFLPVLVSLLAVGVVRHIIYTVTALMSQADPLRSTLAFLYLPVYALWRIPLELAALRMLGNKPWIRTERHVS